MSSSFIILWLEALVGFIYNPNLFFLLNFGGVQPSILELKTLQPPNKSSLGENARVWHVTILVLLYVAVLHTFCSPAARGMYLLQSVGVKLKVWVTDEDGSWSGDDDVDGLVQRLRLTPARSSSRASWRTITVLGQRSSHKTRSIFTAVSDKFLYRNRLKTTDLPLRPT